MRRFTGHLAAIWPSPISLFVVGIMMFALIARKLSKRNGKLLTVKLGRLDGQSMVEYALLLMLIGTVILVVLIVLGNQVHNVFHNVSCSLSAPGGSCAPPED